jgi:hypothetical protein
VANLQTSGCVDPPVNLTARHARKTPHFKVLDGNSQNAARLALLLRQTWGVPQGYQKRCSSPWPQCCFVRRGRTLTSYTINGHQIGNVG